jgi:hypothetical protein
MKDFRLRVLPAISPQRSISNNVNDTETTVEMSKEIYLDCSTEGRPEPIVEWFKDGEPLSVTTNKTDSNKANVLSTLKFNLDTFSWR